MIDRLFQPGALKAPAWVPTNQRFKDGQIIGEGFWRDLSGAQVIIVDNVAEYLFAGTEQEEWSMTDDFPNLAPPFPCFWMEYRRPSKIISTAHVPMTSINTVPWCFGVLLSVHSQSEAGGWNVGGLAFWEHEKGHIIGPVQLIEWPIDPAGRLKKSWRFGMLGVPLERQAEIRPIVDGSNALFFPVALAISFMHCKNVRLLAEDAPEKVSKAYLKKHGRPLVKFKTLEIEPMKQMLRREGQSETTGLKKALHICRGHFATYEEIRPLFGKYAGTFWKPMHLRGTAKQGVVVKDYNVSQPSNDR